MDASRSVEIVTDRLMAGVCWRSTNAISSNLFTKASLPNEIKAVYDSCPPIPPLDILDQFRTDGLSSMKFFVEEWKLLQKEHHRKHVKPLVTEISAASQPADSTEAPLLITTQQKTREKAKVVDLKGSVTSLKLPPPKAAPPPPPPPPPMSLSAPPQVAQTDRPTNDNVAGDMNGFLSAIRGNQFALKKTEIQTKQERKKANEPEEVAAILMRRAALEESSEEEMDDDGDWS